MSVWNNWHRFAALTAFVCAIAIAGCAKKDDAPKAEGDPKPAEVAKDKKKDGDITMDDLRKAAKAAGGDLDKPVPPPKAAESLKDAKADIVLTAEELDRMDFRQVNAFFDKNKGKIIELTGVAVSVGSVVLSAGPDSSGVAIPTTDAEPWKRALPGQTVRLRTRAAEGCIWEIVEVKGPQPPKITVEQFLRDAANQEEMKKKYTTEHLILSGIIENVKVFESGEALVTVKSPGGTATVVCHFRGDSKRETSRNKGFQAGMKLVAVGRYGTDRLVNCEVLELTP